MNIEYQQFSEKVIANAFTLDGILTVYYTICLHEY